MISISPFSLPPFFSALIVAGIGGHVLLKNPRSAPHRAHALFCLSLFIWLASYAVIYSVRDPLLALQLARFSFVGIALLPAANLYFNISLLKLRMRVFMLAIFAAALVFIGSSQTPHIYWAVESRTWGFYPCAGPLHGIFVIFYIATWLYGLYLLYRHMEEKKAGKDYVAFNQVKYVFIAWLGGFLSIVDFMPTYGAPVYPFAYIVAVYWALIAGLAVTRYKLLADVSLLTRRLLIVSGFVGIVAGIYLASLSAIRLFEKLIMPVGSDVALIITSLCLGLATQPLFSKIKKVIDQQFFPEFFDRKEKLARLGHDIFLSKTPEEFHRLILENIFTAFKIIRSSLYVWSEREKAYCLFSASGWYRPSEAQLSKIEPFHPVAKQLETADYILLDKVRTDIASNADQRAVTLAMLTLEVSLCVPIRHGDKLKGFFLFGDKESGLPYSKEDIGSIRSLAEHTAAALEKFDAANRWTEETKQNQQISRILQQYMSPSIADEVLKRADQNKSWKGERRYVTVLVSDLRGFTRIFETHAPEEVVESLNEYFAEMNDIIVSYGGTIDKFMGDAVLVVFGAPTPSPKTESRAVACAIEMQTALKSLNKRREAAGHFPLEVGIGLAAGEVVAGNIGSDRRMQYTVIGDAVNVAARLQSLAQAGQILITTNVLEKVTETVQYRRLYPIRVRGKVQPVEVIEVIGFVVPQQSIDISEPKPNTLNLIDWQDDKDPKRQAS